MGGGLIPRGAALLGCPWGESTNALPLFQNKEYSGQKQQLPKFILVAALYIYSYSLSNLLSLSQYIVHYCDKVHFVYLFVSMFIFRLSPAIKYAFGIIILKQN